VIQERNRQKRIKKLRKSMEENKLDCVLVSKRENYYYFSGFTGDYGFLVISDTRQIVFVDSRFIEQARLEAPGWEIRQFTRIHQDLGSLFEELRAKYVGFESTNLSYADFRELERNSPSKVFVPLFSLFERIRAVKDELELARMKEAILIAESALSQLLKSQVKGRKEEELSLDLEWHMRKNGAQKPGFDLIVASGFRSALPHGVASSKAVKAGEILLFDWGALKDFYCSDITRSFFTRKPTVKQKAVYQAVSDALEDALSFMGPGKKGSDAHKVAWEKILNSPFKEFAFGHGLGHGVGLAVHELPALSPRSEDPLEPGMVVTVEPGIYIPGWGGVRLEEMVLVTKDGAEVLTSFPKGILVI